MLKFGIARTSEGVVVSVNDKQRMRCIEPECTEENRLSWLVRAYDLDICGEGARAASLLHALELGIAAAARWIAVELLRDPVPLGDREPRVEQADGVALALWGQFLCGPWPGYSRHVEDHGDHWDAHGCKGPLPQWCATREQALAVLIEHAAPWIAAALVKEVEA